MCYSSIEIQEVVRIDREDKFLEPQFSYYVSECYQQFENEKIKQDWMMSSSSEKDNIRNFSFEVARLQAQANALILSQKYPQSLVMVQEGNQSCSGGDMEVDIRRFYFAGKEIEIDSKIGLSEELMYLIEIRQKEVEEKEAIDKIQYDNYWAKRHALTELTEKTYKKIKIGTNMSAYPYNDKGLFDTAQMKNEELLVNKAFRAGVEAGVKKAIIYIQENKELLDAINKNFISEEEYHY